MINVDINFKRNSFNSKIEDDGNRYQKLGMGRFETGILLYLVISLVELFGILNYALVTFQLKLWNHCYPYG